MDFAGVNGSIRLGKVKLRAMQSQFSPPMSRLDVVLWFLRVQLWVSVATFLTGFLTPSGHLLGLRGQYLLGFVLPILVLLVFPRALASAMLGQSAREELSSLPGLSSLAGRCVGITLLLGTLGHAVYFGLAVVAALVVRRSFAFGNPYQGFYDYETIAPALSFLVGFALAFGPAIRDSFRSR